MQLIVAARFARASNFCSSSDIMSNSADSVHLQRCLDYRRPRPTTRRYLRSLKIFGKLGAKKIVGERPLFACRPSRPFFYCTYTRFRPTAAAMPQKPSRRRSFHDCTEKLGQPNKCQTALWTKINKKS